MLRCKSPLLPLLLSTVSHVSLDWFPTSNFSISQLPPARVSYVYGKENFQLPPTRVPNFHLPTSSITQLPPTCMGLILFFSFFCTVRRRRTVPRENGTLKGRESSSLVENLVSYTQNCERTLAHLFRASRRPMGQSAQLVTDYLGSLDQWAVEHLLPVLKSNTEPFPAAENSSQTVDEKRHSVPFRFPDTHNGPNG